MSIQDKAVLVELSISVWTGQKIDRDATDKVVSDNRAERGAGQFKKNLMAGSGKRKEIVDYAQECRNWHAKRTLPWADKGARILPLAMFLDYKTESNARKAKFNSLVDDFIADYPAHVAMAQQNLGALFDAADYPSADVVRSKFELRMVFSPIAESSDFRLTAHEDLIEELKQQYEEASDRRVEDAMAVTMERLHTMVRGMSEKLKEPEEDGVKKRYHDTLLTNAQEMVDMLIHLNITGDPKIEAARKALEATIAGADILDIKANPETREEIKENLDKMLGDFW
jgi:hypothetical protein